MNLVANMWCNLLQQLIQKTLRPSETYLYYQCVAIIVAKYLNSIWPFYIYLFTLTLSCLDHYGDHLKIYLSVTLYAIC